MGRKKASYFLLIEPIWRAFEQGKIGIREREAQLAPYRAQLAQHEFKVSKKARNKNQTVNWLINPTNQSCQSSNSGEPQIGKKRSNMNDAAETFCTYQVKWKVKDKDEVKTINVDGEVKARNVAINKSEQNGEAQLGEWQVGDGPKCLLIKRDVYNNGQLTSTHFPSKEGAVIECNPEELGIKPSRKKDKKEAPAEDPLDIPPALKRSKTDKPREAPQPKHEAPVPPAPKKSAAKGSDRKPDAAETTKTETKPQEDTMAKTATAKKTTTKAPAAKKSAAKAPAKKAAKARAATTAKPAKETAKPFVGKAPSHGKAKILEGFSAREGSVRAKLLGALADNAGKPVKIDQLLKTCYGSLNEKNRGALKMVMAGARKTIAEGSLPYQIVMGKTEKGEATMGLFAK